MAIPTLPTFVNGQAPALDAGNLNAIGTAVRDAHARLDTAAGAGITDISRAPGVDPTGVTECASALRDALGAVTAAGGTAYAKGTFRIASRVTIASNANMVDALFNYTQGTGIGVVIGTETSGGWVERKLIYAPRVVCTAKTVSNWSQVPTNIGIQVINLASSNLWLPEAVGFSVGVEFYGRGTGNVHNTTTLGRIYNNQRNMVLLADTTGWTNQNLFLGGRFGHDSNHGSQAAGTRQIDLGVTTNAINNNTWIGASLEGDTSEYNVAVAGYWNEFHNCRWETTGGARVLWRNPSDENLIRGGYGARNIVHTREAGSGSANLVDAPLRGRLTGSGSPQGVVAAQPGTLYTATGGGAGATLWVKESGTGNTGWAAK